MSGWWRVSVIPFINMAMLNAKNFDLFIPIHFKYTGLFKIIVGVQLSSGKFRTKFGKLPPSDNSFRRWYVQIQETGCVCIPELKVRIRTAIETITADMLQTVWNELDYRVDVCRVTKGAHTEQL